MFLTFTRDLLIRNLCMDSLNTSVLPAPSALHTADRCQEFALFYFVFCSYNKLWAVSTDYYFCCFVLWTHRLHREIMLLVKELNTGLVTIEFASILEQSFVPDSLPQCNSNVWYSAVKSKKHCSKRKLASNICGYVLQLQSQFLV
jgi:hypothetical protein